MGLTYDMGEEHLASTPTVKPLFIPHPRLNNSYLQLQQVQSSSLKYQIIHSQTGSYLIVKMRKSPQSLYET